MKRYLLLLLVVSASYGQTKSSYRYLKSDTIEVVNAWVFKDAVQDSLDSLCAERGHIKGGSFTVDIFLPSIKFVDLPDKTLEIHQDQNIEVWTCARCGRRFEGPVQAIPDTTIIWQKEQAREVVK